MVCVMRFMEFHPLLPKHPFLCLTLLMLAVCSSGYASDQVAPLSSAKQQVLGGVIVNQTATVAGNDFYQHFNFFWREQPKHERYSLTVIEKPSVRNGTRIWIVADQKRVFDAALPTNRAQLRALAEQAADLAFQQSEEAELAQWLFRDADLAADEI